MISRLFNTIYRSFQMSSCHSYQMIQCPLRAIVLYFVQPRPVVHMTCESEIVRGWQQQKGKPQWWNIFSIGRESKSGLVHRPSEKKDSFVHNDVVCLSIIYLFIYLFIYLLFLKLVNVSHSTIKWYSSSITCLPFLLHNCHILFSLAIFS